MLFVLQPFTKSKTTNNTLFISTLSLTQLHFFFVHSSSLHRYNSPFGGSQR
ncbi:hypothetical protein HMPREF1320_0572 [Capnocytophaga sp. oral taxon 335 str. F0486]|nr:hypothetical protein HMPREF1320_0572 [Capnocytophaga sp. oral taxon 335 str. F0486]